MPAVYDGTGIYATTRPDTALVRITHKAWLGLANTAAQLGWIRSSKQVHGLGAYLTALAAQDFTDTRPNFLLGTDQWWEGDAAIRRTVRIPPAARARYALIAAKHIIHPHRRQAAVVDGLRSHVNDAPIKASTKLLSATLEAIGLGWLTPTEQPNIPVNLYKQPPRKATRATRTINLY